MNLGPMDAPIEVVMTETKSQALIRQATLIKEMRGLLTECLLMMRGEPGWKRGLQRRVAECLRTDWVER